MCAGGFRSAGERLVAGVPRVELTHGRRLLVAGSDAFAPLRMEAARDLRWRVMRCDAPCARRCVLRFHPMRTTRNVELIPLYCTIAAAAAAAHGETVVFLASPVFSPVDMCPAYLCSNSLGSFPLFPLFFFLS